MYLSGTLVTERDFNVLRWSRGAECKQRSCIKDVLGAGSRKAMRAACQYGCVGLWLMALVSRLGRSSNMSFGCLGLSREWKVQMKHQGRVLEVEEKFTGVPYWLPSTRTWSWREGKQETSPPGWENPASHGHGHGRREPSPLSRVLSLALAALPFWEGARQDALDLRSPLMLFPPTTMDFSLLHVPGMRSL